MIALEPKCLLEEASPVFWPPRSRLYHLEPIGVGTAFVESLTSYIVRLSEAHCLQTSVLVAKEIAPHFKNKNLHSGPRHSDLFRKTGASLNGSCSTSAEAVGILKDLTGRSDLAPLTMQYWSNALCDKSVIHESQKWCSACLKDWRSRRLPIYMPLLWSMQCVKICHVHGQKLARGCCYSHYPLHWHSRSGLCPRCHSWLGDRDRGMVTANEDDPESEEIKTWETFAARAVADILAAVTHAENKPESTTFFRNMGFVLSNHFSSNISALARVVCQSRFTVRHWAQIGGGDRTAVTKPELESVLLAGYGLGLSPVRLLTEKLDDSDLLCVKDAKEICVQRIKKGLRRNDKYMLKKVLEAHACAETIPPLSVAAICRNVKCVPGYVSKEFPELTAAISNRYRTFVGNRSYQRMNLIERRVRSAILALHAEKIFPDLREIENRLREPAMMREKWVKDLWADMLDDLGYNPEMP